MISERKWPDATSVKQWTDLSTFVAVQFFNSVRTVGHICFITFLCFPSKCRFTVLLLYSMRVNVITSKLTCILVYLLHIWADKTHTQQHCAVFVGLFSMFYVPK